MDRGWPGRPARRSRSMDGVSTCTTGRRKGRWRWAQACLLSMQWRPATEAWPVPLHIESAVPEQILALVSRVQDLLPDAHPYLHHVPVEATVGAATGVSGERGRGLVLSPAESTPSTLC